jgi:hypothetical protein
VGTEWPICESSCGKLCGIEQFFSFLGFAISRFDAWLYVSAGHPLPASSGRGNSLPVRILPISTRSLHEGQGSALATSPDRRLRALAVRGGDIYPARNADTSQGTDLASGVLETSTRREALILAVGRDFLRRLLATGRAFDLERGGLYDARSGLVNVWATFHSLP